MNKTISHSELDTFRQCQLKWQLAYKELWQHDDVSPALSRGTLFHSVMELHYKLLQDLRRDVMLQKIIQSDLYYDSMVRAVVHDSGLLWASTADSPNKSQTEEQELVEWMYRGYLDHYEDEPDWEIIDIERTFDQWIYNEAGNRTSFRMVGTADMVVRDWSAGGGLWVVDHKTCKDLPKRDPDFEDQMPIYICLLRKAGYDIRGGIYNYVRTTRLKTREMVPEERFKRVLTARTEQELQTLVNEAMEHMRNAYKKRAGDFPRTPNGETCRWKCNFTEACLAGRKRGGTYMRAYLKDVGYYRAENKPGPTHAKLAEERKRNARGIS